MELVPRQKLHELRKQQRPDVPIATSSARRRCRSSQECRISIRDWSDRRRESKDKRQQEALESQEEAKRRAEIREKAAQKRSNEIERLKLVLLKCQKELKSLTWQQFEDFAMAVLTRLGFSVVQKPQRTKDGGKDGVLERDGVRYLGTVSRNGANAEFMK